MKPARFKHAVVSEPATSLKSPASITVVSESLPTAAHAASSRACIVRTATPSMRSGLSAGCEHTNVEPGAIGQPKPSTHRDPVVRQTVATPGDLGCDLDLRAIFERRRWARPLQPAEQRDAFIEGEFAIAGAVGNGVVEPIEFRVAEPIDARRGFSTPMSPDAVERSASCSAAT